MSIANCTFYRRFNNLLSISQAWCIAQKLLNALVIKIKKDFADELVSVSEQAEEFPHGFTSGGHPVGCAIALKAIDVIINEGLLENVKNVSPYFHERLNEFNNHTDCSATT